tara:strand:+ start:371 stop:550 length:180 start_codon:yes stop_codon:yes gene_type:complete
MLARYSEPVDNTVESYDSSHLDVMFVVSSATTQEITKRREVKGKKRKNVIANVKFSLNQ